MSASLLDEAFALLGEATSLEQRATSSEKNVQANASSALGNQTQCEDPLPSAPPPELLEEIQDPQWLSIMEQSASKYHEACYLMKSHVRRTSQTSPGAASNSGDELAKMRQLIKEKIEFYEGHAEELLKKVKDEKASVQRRRQEIQQQQQQWRERMERERQEQQRRRKEEMEKERERERQNNKSGYAANDGSTSRGSNEYSARRNASMKNYKQASLTDVLQYKSKADEEATRAAAKATLQLTSAIDCDERGEVSAAISHYMEAVEFYLKAVKLLAPENEANHQRLPSNHQHDEEHEELVSSLKRKIMVTLDRVEVLKRRESYSAAAPQSSPTDITAIDTTRNNNNHRSSFNQESLTPYEIAVLRRSSLIASGLFLPWSDEEALTYDYFGSFPISPKQSSSSLPTPLPTPWSDPDGLLPLSDKQKQKAAKWARPSEIIAMRCNSSRKSSSSTPSHPSHCSIKMINSITPHTIKQYCVSDCSFIAALCISASYERRFQRRLISSLIYPQDPKTKMPIYNPRGVYMVKLWLNGVARRVLVDDLLPVDRKGNLLCSHTMGGWENGGVLELWVSILEKAYMKLCGGYNFPGSNSGVDLFSLTGWIPERLFFPDDPNNVQDFETPPERAWERLYSANSYGDCLITVATSKELTEESAEQVGLFTGHAYAVLSVVQTSNGTRLLQLKNPWASESWKGKYSALDRQSWSDPSFCAEVGYNAHTSSRRDDGVFWISWEDALFYFRNLHISWNCHDLFRFRTTVHGFWNKDTGPTDDSFNVGENPQYTVTFSEKAMEKQATLWILLSRHVTKQEQEGAEATDFLTLHIYRIKSRQRVYYPGENCVLTNAYTNNQHVLVRYDITGPQDKYLSIVLSQFQKSNDLGYTISCYCTNKFKLGQPEQELPLCKTVKGFWELRDEFDKSFSLKIGSAGGRPGMGSFGSNPQWGIFVPAGGARLQCKCLSPKALAVNVVLTWISCDVVENHESQSARCKRIHNLYEQPVLDSGNYRYGFAVTEQVNLDGGTYTLVASTFEVGEVGKFWLYISSSKAVDVVEIPR